VPLNPFDDFPFHQAVAPIDVPATSDTHFNDGYYFAFYRPGLHVFCGLRLHPNSNVMDGYAGVVTSAEQRSVRFSRALRPRANDLAVGPFRLDILEPMTTQRLRLDDPDLGLAFDVVLRASAPAFFEARHRQVRHGRLFNDVLRYTQVARAQGELTVDGEREAVDGWYACRDHSWGIRSTMGPHAPIGGLEEESLDPRALRLWVPFECGDVAGFFHCHEAHDGRVLDCEGRLDRTGRSSLRIEDVRHTLRYEEGTRRLAGGDLTLVDEHGAGHEYRFDVACAPAHPQGFGYTRGWSDGGQPGVYRGTEVIEHDRFDVSDPNVVAGAPHLPPARRLGGTEFTSVVSGPDGAEGMAHVEHMLYPARAAAGARGGVGA
jgi:hypothetical protein